MLLAALLQVAVSLPSGYQAAHWGMTVDELRSLTSVQRAGHGRKFGYADHAEIDPDVYVHVTQDKTRIEYYFFKGRLYKVFLVYDRSVTSPEFYQELVQEHEGRYGPFQAQYPEEFFGYVVQHTRWENAESVLDLRMGAGFVYQVRIDKKAAEAKALQQDMKKAI